MHRLLDEHPLKPTEILVIRGECRRILKSVRKELKHSYQRRSLLLKKHSRSVELKDSELSQAFSDLINDCDRQIKSFIEIKQTATEQLEYINEVEIVLMLLLSLKPDGFDTISIKLGHDYAVYLRRKALYSGWLWFPHQSFAGQGFIELLLSISSLKPESAEALLENCDCLWNEERKTKGVIQPTVNYAKRIVMAVWDATTYKFLKSVGMLLWTALCYWAKIKLGW